MHNSNQILLSMCQTHQIDEHHLWEKNMSQYGFTKNPRLSAVLLVSPKRERTSSKVSNASWAACIFFSIEDTNLGSFGRARHGIYIYICWSFIYIYTISVIYIYVCGVNIFGYFSKMLACLYHMASCKDFSLNSAAEENGAQTCWHAPCHQMRSPQDPRAWKSGLWFSTSLPAVR